MQLSMETLITRSTSIQQNIYGRFTVESHDVGSVVPSSHNRRFDHPQISLVALESPGEIPNCGRSNPQFFQVPCGMTHLRLAMNRKPGAPVNIKFPGTVVVEIQHPPKIVL